MTNHPSNQPAQNHAPKKSHYAIAGVIGAILLIVIGVLAYSSVQKGQELDQAYVEVNEIHSLQSELDQQYNAAIAELESLKGTNSEMDALIETQKAELAAQKDKISGLLKERKNLDRARAEMGKLKSQIESYAAEMEMLKADNQKLTETNQQLNVEKTEVFNQLQTRQLENEELNTAKAELVSQNEELSSAVKVGSVIKVKNVRVEGMKVRSNGKVKGKKSAKKVDQLQICFTTTTNDIVQSGTEEFYVRILNPRGETLAIEDMGSGYVTNEKSGEEVRFTQAAEMQYANDEENMCMTWNPDIPFESGEYQVEVYNKGFLAGTGSFELK